jgi:hypothetical protein
MTPEHQAYIDNNTANSIAQQQSKTRLDQWWAQSQPQIARINESFNDLIEASSKKPPQTSEAREAYAQEQQQLNTQLQTWTTRCEKVIQAKEIQLAQVATNAAMNNANTKKAYPGNARKRHQNAKTASNISGHRNPSKSKCTIL